MLVVDLEEHDVIEIGLWLELDKLGAIIGFGDDVIWHLLLKSEGGLIVTIPFKGWWWFWLERKDDEEVKFNDSVALFPLEGTEGDKVGKAGFLMLEHIDKGRPPRRRFFGSILVVKILVGTVTREVSWRHEAEDVDVLLEVDDEDKQFLEFIADDDADVEEIDGTSVAVANGWRILK